MVVNVMKNLQEIKIIGNINCYKCSDKLAEDELYWDLMYTVNSENVAFCSKCRCDIKQCYSCGDALTFEYWDCEIAITNHSSDEHFYVDNKNVHFCGDCQRRLSYNCFICEREFESYCTFNICSECSNIYCSRCYKFGCIKCLHDKCQKLEQKLEENIETVDN
jgi:hypothetical protein